MSALLSFLSILLVSSKATSDSSYNLPFSTNLDTNKLVSLEWGFDKPQGNITFKLMIKTTGWVGFGFSPDGGMVNADIVMGGVRSSGNYFHDYYSTGEVMPVVDTQQSYTLLSMNETNGETVMTFQRPMNTADNQDFAITDAPINLIYAYGETDDIGYHKNYRGHKKVNLLKYTESAASRIYTSWILNIGGILLLLLWIDIM